MRIGQKKANYIDVLSSRPNWQEWSADMMPPVDILVLFEMKISDE